MDQLIASLWLGMLALTAVAILWYGFRQMRERARCPQCQKLGLRSAGNSRSLLFQATLGGPASYTYVCKYCGHKETVEAGP